MDRIQNIQINPWFGYALISLVVAAVVILVSRYGATPVVPASEIHAPPPPGGYPAGPRMDQGSNGPALVFE